MRSIVTPLTIVVLALAVQHAAPAQEVRWRQAFTRPTSGAYVLGFTFGEQGDIYCMSYDALHRSTDQGATWTRCPLTVAGSTEMVKAMLLTPEGDVVAAVSTIRQQATPVLYVLRSTDDGASWTKQSENEWDFAGGMILSLSGSLFTGIGKRGLGNIYRSSDLGATWTKLSYGADCPPSVLLCTPSGAILVNSFCLGNYNIRRSTDDGETWAQVEGPKDTRALIHDGDGCIFASATGGVFRSCDDGDTWEPVNNGLPQEDILFLTADSRGQVFAASMYKVFRSTDRGATWTNINADLPNNFLTAFTIDADNYLYSALYGDVVYRTAGPTSAVPGSLAPSSTRLAQNVPNPASAATSIDFELTNGGPVRIDLFDAQGQRIATLLDETKAPGAHSIPLDAGRLEPGVYSYRLRAGESVTSRSMVVVR